MSEKKFNYVYLTTNLVNGKQYVGDHSTNNLEDHYLGGGKYLGFAIQKYGKEKFKKEIIDFFPTKKEAFNAQESLIKKHNTLNPNGYNLSSKGGHQCKNSVSEETKKLIGEKTRLAFKNKVWNFSEEHRNNLSKSLSGRTLSEDHAKKTRIARLNKPASEQSKAEMRRTRKGKKKTWKNVICPYCKLEGKGPNMTRYHFNNCKLKKEII